MHEASFFRRFWGGAVSMPIKTLFFVYLFWIKFCLSERLRDCTLVHSLSLICYLVRTPYIFRREYISKPILYQNVLFKAYSNINMPNFLPTSFRLSKSSYLAAFFMQLLPTLALLIHIWMNMHNVLITMK